MTLRLPTNETDRYDWLASLNWPVPKGKELKQIPAGTKVSILQRGSFTTDDKGVTLAINGWSQSELMRGTMNHAWEIWVRPELERYRAEGIALPEEVRSVLVKREDDHMRLHVNTSAGTGHMMLRPGISIQKGDKITSDMILDVVDITPPTHAGCATQYFLVRFNGEQISIVFDMRPGDDDGPMEWSYEDQQWYGNALAEQVLAGVYGHLILSQQRLVECDIPFSLGLQSEKMNCITQAADMSKSVAIQYIEDHIYVEDWQPLVAQWTSSNDWKHRGPLFTEALSTYKAGHFAATIALLMPQIEGTIMEYLVRKGKGLKNNGRSKKWSSINREPSVLTDLEEDLRANDYGYVRQTIAYTLLDFLRKSSLYSRFSWRDGGEPTGRHPILHGYEVNFGSKVNADCLLMVLDSLFWLIGAKSAKRDDEIDV